MALFLWTAAEIRGLPLLLAAAELVAESLASEFVLPWPVDPLEDELAALLALPMPAELLENELAA